jgi:tRNA threonylcarbamoyl adenosine modification protein (Sua5/YciO/YrdC/YwlC family)
MRLEVDPWASQKRELHKAVQLLDRGGVLVIPTDSGYALAADLHNNKAIDKIYDLKQSPRSHPLAILFADVDDIGRYAGHVPALAYRTMKKVLPGPYTFILPAGAEVPKRMHKKRKEVGVRVPDADVPRELVRMLGRPLASTSLRIYDDGEERFIIDPMDIDKKLGAKVDAFIDSGIGIEDPTTVIDLRSMPFEVLREGQGSLEDLL